MQGIFTSLALFPVIHPRKLKAEKGKKIYDEMIFEMLNIKGNNI